MKALLCDEPGRLTLVDRDEPRPKADEVLVRLRRAGVCGTDYHIYHGNQPYLSYPRVMGHELAGVVEAAPDGSSLARGQVVAIEPYIWCGTCRACRRGLTNCCRNLQVFGVHRDGGFCEWLCVPERNVVPADGLDLDAAAMVEFLAIGAHGVRRSGAGPDDRVAIVGAGPIGLAAALFAKARGAHVSVIDFNESRLAFAAAHARADAVHQAGSDLDDRLSVETGGDFFDVVIDATGSPAAMAKGFGYVGHGGTYVLLSIVRAAISFDDPEFHKRETSLLGSRNATRQDFDTVLSAMRAGQVPLRALASHRGSLAEAADLIPVWSKPESRTVKALIEI